MAQFTPQEITPQVLIRMTPQELIERWHEIPQRTFMRMTERESEILTATMRGMTRNEKIAFDGRTMGPVMPLPEDYEPYVMISDAEFAAMCEKRDRGENVSKKERFYGRDYVVDHYKRSLDLIYRLPEYESHTLYDYYSELPKEELSNLFWGLDSCTCCWRHCHKRPLAVDSMEDRNMLDVATVEMVSENSCKCYCRHIKRHLRRGFFLKKEDEVDKSPLEWEEPDVTSDGGAAADEAVDGIEG